MSSVYHPICDKCVGPPGIYEYYTRGSPGTYTHGQGLDCSKSARQKAQAFTALGALPRGAAEWSRQGCTCLGLVASGEARVSLLGRVGGRLRPVTQHRLSALHKACTSARVCSILSTLAQAPDRT